MVEILNLSWSDEDGGQSKYFPNKLRALICGPSGSGKTQLLMNIILQKWFKFKKLVLVSSSLDQPMYKVLINGLSNNVSFEDLIYVFLNKNYIKKNGIPIDDLMKHLQSNNNIPYSVHNSIETLDDPDSFDEGTLVVFDDLMLDKGAIKKAEEFFTRGRPMGISIIFLTQSYYEVPRRTIRENCNFLILFKQNKKSLDHLHKDAASEVEAKEFRDFCLSGWSHKHSFIVIDSTRPSDSGRYRHGLDQVYIPSQYKI